MQCGSCGRQNRDGSRFCVDCGQPLALTCPSCASPVEEATRFCAQCGTALAGAGAAAATEGPVAERRMCSVLFCDLVGFTPLSEARDPEEVRELLSAYFETASTVIRRYGGVVEKFIGDAVMAVWGTPVATEGDAERAVRAALDLIDTVRRSASTAASTPSRPGPASSPARSPSRSGRPTRAWSPATPSTPRPACSPPPRPARCWSTRRRGG